MLDQGSAAAGDTRPAAPVGPPGPGVRPPVLAGRRATLVVLTIAYSALLGTLMQSLIVPIIGRLPEYLDSTPTDTSWLVTAMLLSGAVSSALFGRLADMYGKRRILLVCLASLVAGSVLGTFADSVGWMIVARVLQGLAMAIVPIGIGALRDLIAGDRMIRGIALISALAGIGGSLGAAVAAAVAEFLPWHALFAGSAILAAIAFVATVLLLPPIPGTPGGRLDVVGVIGLVAGLVAVLLAISNGGRWGWTSAATLGCFGGGLLVLLLWGWYEVRVRNPLIDLRTAAARPVLFTNLATAAVGFAMYGMLLAQPQLVQIPTETGYGLGESILVSGLTVAPGALFALFVPSLAARLIERKGPRVSIVVGALVLASGYLLLIVEHTTLWSMFGANILTAIGIAFCFSATPNLILRHVPRSQTAQANGVSNVFRSIGTSSSAAVTSAILAGMLITEGFGSGELPSQAAFLTVFVVGGVASLLVLPLVALVGRERPHGDRI